MSVSNAKTYSYYKLGNIVTELYLAVLILSWHIFPGKKLLQYNPASSPFAASVLHQWVCDHMIPQLFISSMRANNLSRIRIAGSCNCCHFHAQRSCIIKGNQIRCLGIQEGSIVSVVECWHLKGSTQLENHYFITESALPIPSEPWAKSHDCEVVL